MMKDVIVEEVRRVRAELIERHGGIDGYVKHCQEQERRLAAAKKSRRQKPRTRVGRKRARAT